MRWENCVSSRVVAYDDGRAAEDKEISRCCSLAEKTIRRFSATYNLTNNVMYMYGKPPEEVYCDWYSRCAGVSAPFRKSQ